MPQCGTCVYEWDDGWVMVDGCETGCECEHPPSYEGSPGSYAVVSCAPEASASGSTVIGLGFVTWSPWYRPGVEKHSVMRRGEAGWHYYYYGPDRTPKIQSNNELLLAYPVGTLLVISKSGDVIGTGMVGRIPE